MTRTVEGVTLDGAQLAEWDAIRQESGSDNLADQVFALCHVHDGDRWVPLDLFEMAERDPARAVTPE